VIGAALPLACGASTPTGPPRADPQRGLQAIQHYGCSACHVIPGVGEGSGMTGPSLAGFAQRETIVGVLPNERAALVQWLRNPAAVKPDTAMPSFSIREGDLYDIAAYLATLH
jgi:cytochrome c2